MNQEDLCLEANLHPSSMHLRQGYGILSPCRKVLCLLLQWKLLKTYFRTDCPRFFNPKSVTSEMDRMEQDSSSPYSSYRSIKCTEGFEKRMHACRKLCCYLHERMNINYMLHKCSIKWRLGVCQGSFQRITAAYICSI